MEKVVRVSIANLAFILEEEAYSLLNTYIDTLKEHYSAHENGTEIIDGIEERIADLLSERIPGGDVVPATTVGEVIALLGQPGDIDREAGDVSVGDVPRRLAKRLYRDPSRRVLGGVSSGFSAYFNIDVVLVRLIFVVLLVSNMFWFKSTWPVVPFLYLVLWIVIPKARTVAQKYAMRGEAFSISGIERNVEAGGVYPSAAPNRFWSGAGRIVAFCMGVLLTVLGVSGVIGFMTAFSGLHFFHNSFGEIAQMLLNRSETFFCMWKVVLLLAAFLPFIGLLYTGIRLLFRFKSPKWRPGLVIFLVWIVSFLATVSLSLYASSRYFNSQSFSRKEIVESRDTLYIRYDRLEEWRNDRLAVSAGWGHYSFALLENNGSDGVRMITYPVVDLWRDTSNHQLTVRGRTQMFTSTIKGADLKEIMDVRFYRLAGDTLYLSPLVYDKEHEVHEAWRRVNLHIRPSTQVIIEQPAPHRFDKRFQHNNWLDFLSN